MRNVKLTQEVTANLWVAEDQETGIASQGATVPDALRALAEALELAAEE